MYKKEKTAKGWAKEIIIAIVVFALSYYGVKHLFNNDMEAELKTAAIELNKQTPMQIDQHSRLDSVSSIGKTNFIYYYTFIKIEKAEVNLDTVYKYIRPNIIENVKKSPDLKVLRDNDVIIDYKYYDKNGENVMEISVTPELYNKD